MSASVSPLRAPTGSPQFPKLEKEVLEFWEDNGIYQQSLDRRADGPQFVFYEGPPTANGMPHPGHCLTRSIKDVFPRYKTMQGFRCERKAGWDTHGLPVEVEVGKELGIHSKEEIEAYGIEPFIQKCQSSVWRYMQQWQTLTQRLGFWVDLDEAYVTYHQSYVESVWWSLKTLFDRGLLYQGHKIVWWWAQGGTALSAGEVGQGYREVADPSVYVLFPLVDHPGRSLVVWTTTPWTLPSNMYAAVHPTAVEYSVVKDEETGQELVLASALVETIAAKLKRELPVVETVSAESLIGQRYEPPFPDFHQATGDPVGKLVGGETQSKYWRVVAADFVTTESGSGIVHQAPAFGEVDYDVLIDQQKLFVDGDGPELLCAVGPDGKFTDAFAEMKGVWVKDADKPISRKLKENGRLLFLEQYLHDYPFCWRASEDPLIQYPRESWFVRTTEFKDEMLANNAKIGWQPGHIQDGRFGNFLASNVDWALSRERFWGTPLPIWVCQETGQMEAIGCYDELLAKPDVQGTEVWAKAKAENPELVDDLRVHKPYIDAVTYASPFSDGARMQRVTEVIDCWYDSGAMPFAQWGYPHQNADRFLDQFPADFISEALDQTRGWFYSQLAISTMLFGKDSPNPIAAKDGLETPKYDYPHPFRNCIVLGLMLGEDGKKMSKKDKNFREPNEIFDKYGADALRWFFFSKQTPWTAIQYKEQAIKDSIPEFLLRLWNVFSFLTIYAEIDGFDPTTATAADDQLSPSSLASAPGYRDASERSEIDRWILSELNQTIATVTERMDALDNYNACRAITGLVDGLSNWFVRRSRDRFWAKDTDSQDKNDAYWTLYESLLEVTKLVAPFVPFLSETLWKNLTSPFSESVLGSVHLCDYPKPIQDRIDPELSESMHLLREIASMGRAARAEAKLKVRLPLSQVEVVLTDDSRIDWLKQHDDLVKEELNVKTVDYTTEADKYVQYTVVPNFKRLGPKVGKQIPAVKKALAEADGNDLLQAMQRDGKVTLELPGGSVDLDDQDIEVRLQAREGWAAAQGSRCVVVLNTEVTDELRREGIAKDLIRTIQNQRKEIQCEYLDRIEVAVETDMDEVILAIKEHGDQIANETLADTVTLGTLPDVDPIENEYGRVFVRRSSSSPASGGES
ncbi:Isoleucine--tRNA ligase [Rubripirellula obstinata]|uniref:Isoleucine--tRNA ligase n=1 Tax=Rubripirellula obstinata TaxID=406547 RepID=A0A5B1CE89_9BACT|nr:isoleucine--tRNA ligase [Rubripirellula obstinata]KAA1258896.1 Isoleucine--tRNA ligase [Rubripirellula obstinata]